jgi:hypothetical protein
MKVHQGVTAGLLVACGALLTWATASAMEQYAADKLAASAARNAGGTAAPYNPGEPPRRTF